MFNTILLTLFLSFGAESTNATYQVSTTNSNIAWVATKVVGGRHNGTINLKNGTLEINEGQLVGGAFTMDMTTIVCDDLEGEWKEKLEQHLDSDDFFSVKQFTTAQLIITNVQSQGGKFTVSADITIKGKTEKVSFPTTLTLARGKATATATISLDRTKFGVRFGSNSFFDNLGDKAISDEFILEVTLVAIK